MILSASYDVSIYHHFLLVLGRRCSILLYVFKLPFILYALTYTDKSASEWPTLSKWAATGDYSVVPWTMSNVWPFILLWSGCPDSPTYWRPHFLHSIR